MKKILTLALVGAVALGAMTFISCSGGEEPAPEGGGEASSVVKADWYSGGRITTLFNPMRYVYYIRWPAIPGAESYVLYKSTSATGDGTRVEETSELSVDGATETLTTAGTFVRYYWVAAKTSSGETSRPTNGGIKVTYTVTVATRIPIYGGPPLYQVTYITTGVDSIDSEVEQNPIK
jgi:hypothetical protein